MSDEDPTKARETLAAAQRAQEAGVRAGARPAWYPVALGLSVAFALASFAVPWLTVTGVVLGAVILPIAIETTARKVSGASPLGDYLGNGSRGPVVVSIAIVLAVTAAALVLLKTTGAVWGVLVGAVIVGVATAACAWWLRHRRSETGVRRDGRR